MSKILDIRHYQPVTSEKFLFDTNIWIYLYYPMGDYDNHKARNYANFFQRARNVHSTLLTSALIISEFINRCLRFEFAILQEKEPDKYIDFKKDYRATDKFLEDMELIRSIIQKKILNRTKRIDDNFSRIDESLLFDNVDTNFDFNDKMHQLMALSNESSIVTEDADFLTPESHITIITANRRMLPQNQDIL